MSFKILKAAFGRFYDLPEDATKRDVEDRINAIAQQDPEVRLYARDLMLYTIARELSELRRQVGRVVKDELTPMGGALDAIAGVVEGLGDRLQELAAHELADEDDDDPDTEDERPVEREPTEPEAKRVPAPVDQAKPVDQAEHEQAKPEAKQVRAPRPRKADTTDKPKGGKRGEIVVTEEATP